MTQVDIAFICQYSTLLTVIVYDDICEETMSKQTALTLRYGIVEFIVPPNTV